jgi:hypothetical protein
MFLTDDERQFVIRTLKEDSFGQATHFNVNFIWQALADWKTYVQILTYLGCVIITLFIDMAYITCQSYSVLIPVYGVALFTPTIINDLGFSAARAQLLSIPPFVCGCISTVIIGIYSDRMNLRGPFVAFGASVSMIGYILAYVTSKPGLGYAAAIIAATGVFPTIAVILAWAGGNAGGDLKRGVVLAMVIGIGNLGGYVAILSSPMVMTWKCSICSSYIYYQPPRFHKGHGTIIGCLGMRYGLAYQHEGKTQKLPLSLVVLYAASSLCGGTVRLIRRRRSCAFVRELMKTCKIGIVNLAMRALSSGEHRLSYPQAYT